MLFQINRKTNAFNDFLYIIPEKKYKLQNNRAILLLLIYMDSILIDC